MIILALLLAYLLGSISSSIILCKLLKYPDPRQIGSGNAGATNLLRYTNSKIAFLVLLLDCLKGFISIYIARYFGIEDSALSFVVLAVTVGHIYPIFFHFKGGKGVATAWGALFALSPLLSSIALIIWIIIAVITRYSSLSSIGATLSIIVTSFFLSPQYIYGLIPLSLLILWKHRLNIKRLYQGNESKIGKKV